MNEGMKEECVYKKQLKKYVIHIPLFIVNLYHIFELENLIKKV